MALVRLLESRATSSCTSRTKRHCSSWRSLNGPSIEPSQRATRQSPLRTWCIPISWLAVVTKYRASSVPSWAFQRTSRLIRRESSLQPRGSQTQVYSVSNYPLCLVGTSEIPLMGLYADQIIDPTLLPIRLVGFGKYGAPLIHTPTPATTNPATSDVQMLPS